MDRRIGWGLGLAAAVVACGGAAGDAMRDAGEAMAGAGGRLQDAGMRLLADAAIDAGGLLGDAGAALGDGGELLDSGAHAQAPETMEVSSSCNEVAGRRVVTGDKVSETRFFESRMSVIGLRPEEVRSAIAVLCDRQGSTIVLPCADGSTCTTTGEGHLPRSHEDCYATQNVTIENDRIRVPCGEQHIVGDVGAESTTGHIWNDVSVSITLR